MKHQLKKYKKGSLESTSRDGLSELPDNVIIHILSFLPVSDAVKTVLLRRFGNLWTMVPSLHLCSRHTTLPFFLNFVRNVVVFHRYPTIDEFHLETHHEVPEVEMWTRFALSKEAKVLKVDFNKKNLCTLPRCVFFNQSLVSLEIRHCNIEQQSRVHMASLRKLVLEDVCFSDDKMLEQIVSGCPSLEELVIFAHFTYLSLSISSTNIKLLKLVGNLKGTIDCPYLRTLHILIIHHRVFGLVIIDVSSLNEVEIDVIGYSSKNHCPPLLSLLEKVGNAELVKLSGSTLDMLSGVSMRELARTSNRWKHLILKSQLDKANILAICGLVRNSASLEELTVYAYSKCYLFPMMEILDNNMFVQELSTPCVMPKLKIVTIHGFMDLCQVVDQLPLVEFLLKNAVNLEKLVFVSKQEEQLEFVKQVASLRRASSNATVVFARKSC